MNAQRSSEDSRRAAVGLAHAAPDAFLSFDEGLTINYWNPAAEKMFGPARHEAVGLVFSQFLSMGADATLKAHLQNGQTQAPIELSCRSASGRRFSAEAYLVVSEQDGVGFTGLIVRDLSQTTAIRRYLQYVTRPNSSPPIRASNPRPWHRLRMRSAVSFKIMSPAASPIEPLKKVNWSSPISIVVNDRFSAI